MAQLRPAGPAGPAGPRPRPPAPSVAELGAEIMLSMAPRDKLRDWANLMSADLPPRAAAAAAAAASCPGPAAATQGAAAANLDVRELVGHVAARLTTRPARPRPPETGPGPRTRSPSHRISSPQPPSPIHRSASPSPPRAPPPPASALSPADAAGQGIDRGARGRPAWPGGPGVDQLFGQVDDTDPTRLRVGGRSSPDDRLPDWDVSLAVPATPPSPTLRPLLAHRHGGRDTARWEIWPEWEETSF